jgi:hypothetical protein
LQQPLPQHESFALICSWATCTLAASVWQPQLVQSQATPSLQPQSQAHAWQSQAGPQQQADVAASGANREANSRAIDFMVNSLIVVGWLKKLSPGA